MSMNFVAEEFLPDEKLLHLSGCDRLEQVRFLQMTVDTSEQTLGDLGVRLPGLDQLKLSNSNISTLRDLGTALQNLRVLWIARSGLQELEGVGAFGQLTELYLAFNSIHDLSPLMDIEHLQVLDLESNAIDDVAQVQYLCSCTELRTLTLEGNPIADADDYREIVISTLPQLELLDELGVSEHMRPSATQAELRRDAALYPMLRTCKHTSLAVLSV